MTALAHREIGHGGSDVVFLHGLFGQGRNWTTIANGVADLATSTLLDLPNHGDSPWTADFTLDSQAGIVADWLRARFGHPVALVGHSLGGKLAMRLALAHPELVARLVVVDISPAPNPAASEFAPLVAALRGLDLDRLGSRREADALLTGRIPDAAVRGFLLQSLRHGPDGWRFACNLRLLGDSLAAIGGWPPIEGRYPGPVIWVAGGRSPYVRPEHREPMRTLFPGTVTVTLKAAGHWVHSEQPDAFVAVLRRFLTS